MAKESPSWFQRRTYLHFDRPVGAKKAERIVSDPSEVARHSFFPFLTYKITSHKARKTEAGNMEMVAKERPIHYAAHMDSHIYSYYAEILSELYEKKLSELGISSSVLAFRKLGKSNIEFAKDAFDIIKMKAPCVAVGYDVSKFFQKIDHAKLKATWAGLLDEDILPKDHHAVFRSLTKYAEMDRGKVYEVLGLPKYNKKSIGPRICSPYQFRETVRPSKEMYVNDRSVGIPQGSPISALLSNIYMLDFDCAIAEVAREAGAYYCRYCDDILVVCDTDNIVDFEDLIRRELGKLKLDINEQKTDKARYRVSKEKVYCDRAIQYLGFLFDGESVFLRSASLARYSERMRRGVHLAKKTKKKYNKMRVKRGEAIRRLYKKKLYARYSHLGRRNFVRYGLRAADIMDSKEIRRQLKPLWRRLKEEMEK